MAMRCLRSVLLRAFASVHSARNCSDHVYSRGSVEKRNRSAWSLRNSDFSRIHGARGEDQTKEWPGAIMPALPQLVSCATPGLRSSSTTSWWSLSN
jgi:hypothetical protein